MCMIVTYGIITFPAIGPSEGQYSAILAVYCIFMEVGEDGAYLVFAQGTE